MMVTLDCKANLVNILTKYVRDRECDLNPEVNAQCEREVDKGSGWDEVFAQVRERVQIS